MNHLQIQIEQVKDAIAPSTPVAQFTLPMAIMFLGGALLCAVQTIFEEVDKRDQERKL